MLLASAACLWIDGNTEFLVVVDVEYKAIEHLVDRLWAVFNALGWIGIVGIEVRVIEMGDCFDRRSFGQDLRPGLEFIAQLPFEVVVGDLQQAFPFPIGHVGKEGHVPASHVHVREQP